jgi:hypothetical protein
MQTSRDEILKNLETLRAQQGEEAYGQARDALALMLINQPRGEDFLKETFPDLDLDRIRELARQNENGRKAQAPANDMLALIRTHVPHLQTQAQLDVFMLAFNAFTLTFDSYFAGNVEAAKTARASMDKALDLVQEAGAMAGRVAEIPPEERSPEAAKYVEPPKLFTEADEKNKLVAELETITTSSSLNEWYRNERKRIEGVVSKTLRDELFDAIRSKQSQFIN